MQTELVQATTQDDFILNGLFNTGDKAKPVVILVHGFTSDFYSHKFFHQIQTQLSQKSIASLAIQTRGTGIRTEFLKSNRDDGKWIGSFYEKLDEAHLDITAWIKFLESRGHNNVVLAGHSLGTIKSVRYLFEGEFADRVAKLVLLAPFDKNGYLERLAPGKRAEYLAQTSAKIAEGKGEETIPPQFDDYPMSFNTFHSWYEDSHLSNIWDFYRADSYDFPILDQIAIPVMVIAAEDDDFLYIPELSKLEDVHKVLSSHIKNLELNITAELNSSNSHCFVDREDQVANLVVEFVDAA